VKESIQPSCCALDDEEYHYGGTGPEVSRICPGCMTFGAPGRGTHRRTLQRGEEPPSHQAGPRSRDQFLDTAHSYSDGGSEEIAGRALKDFARRAGSTLVHADAGTRWRRKKPQCPKPLMCRKA